MDCVIFAVSGRIVLVRDSRIGVMQFVVLHGFGVLAARGFVCSYGDLHVTVGDTGVDDIIFVVVCFCCGAFLGSILAVGADEVAEVLCTRPWGRFGFCWQCIRRCLHCRWSTGV